MADEGETKMSYWSHNPEKLDEITTDCLPEPYKKAVLNDELLLDEVPEAIRDKAMEEGIEDYWAGLIDRAMMEKGV